MYRVGLMTHRLLTSTSCQRIFTDSMKVASFSSSIFGFEGCAWVTPTKALTFKPNLKKRYSPNGCGCAQSNFHCAAFHVKSASTRNFGQMSFRNLLSRTYQSFRSQKFSMENDAVQKHLQKMLQEYEELTTRLLEPGAVDDQERKGLGKIHWKLTPLVECVKEYETKKVELAELEKMLENLDASDGEMLELTKKEKEDYMIKLEKLENQILHLMIPPELIDDSDIILEVQAGVGGQEAMLFTREIFNLYENYAMWRGWKFEVLECEQTELGGIRRASASIHGLDVFKFMKFEGGVHRVQRVPQTEKSGRVHTSTMTVAILPQPHDIDVSIDPSDLKIDTFRASGKGGQHVNKTESAVRITHIPSRIVAECQADRSQIKNKETAMKILKSRLYQVELDKQTSQQQNKRKLQVGTRGRSEKIRTYNYSQDRVTDHRVKASVHNLEGFLEGGEIFHEMVENLQEESRHEILEEIID